MPEKGWPEEGQCLPQEYSMQQQWAALISGVYLIGYCSWTTWAIPPLGFADLAVQIDCVALESFYPHRSWSCSCGSQGAKLPTDSSSAPSTET